MTETIDHSQGAKNPGAPEERKGPENPVNFSKSAPEIPASKPKARFGAGGPKGNKFALKHGGYEKPQQWTDEDKTYRKQWEEHAIEEKGDPSHLERCLIRTASYLDARLKRVWRAMENGDGEPATEHLISWVNSLRLILCALGLERKQRKGPSLQDYLNQKAQDNTTQEKPQ